MIARVEAIARAAGEVLRAHFGKIDARTIGRKSSSRDLVTEADRASERRIVADLRGAFPGEAIRGEEEVREEGKGGPLWHVDPLDGTINFVHGVPVFGVSIARYVEGKPHLAVVYNPVLEEMFAAEAGKGATLNGAPIRVSREETLADALLVTGFPYRRGELANNNLDNFVRFFFEARGIRRIGAASVDLAWVAAGRFDGFWELHLEPHDVAAGALLVREAGGKVTDFDGGENWLEGANVVATNGRLHEAVRRRVRA
ncbi:MAG TPA: inositol monophosphatase family protein [Planctomycetota bacterium]|jgi:myo-inositol-1(or 4)-monophosphatase|nr:inositol monophosphatase family protein [Planctomycetota bacterium]